MAFQTVSSDIIASTYTVADTDIITLFEGVTIANVNEGFRAPFGSSPTLDDVTLNIFGSLIGGIRGIDLYSDLPNGGLSNTSVFVGETGSVRGDVFGVLVRGGFNNSVTNYGTISGNSREGLFIDGGLDNSVGNHGSISSMSSSGLLYAGSGEVAGNVVNTGTITGRGTDLFSAAVYIGRGSLVNSGTIIALDRYAVGINFEGSITNSGLIMGDVVVNLGASYTVYNSGEITGSVTLGTGADEYRATGTGSAAEIFMQGGDDVAIGAFASDSINGGDGEDTIFGYYGDDVLDGGTNSDQISGGAGADSIDGGSGADRIFGGSGDDFIEGGTSLDTIRGGSGDDLINGDGGGDLIRSESGDDTVFGGTGSDNIGGSSGDDIINGDDGNDRLNGGSGSDVVEGGGGDDRVSGAQGDDFITGGDGEDRLSGGSGFDTLEGGADQDRMRGGTGEDVFLFTTVSDSAQGSGTRDVIFDFNPDEDIIDLSALPGTLTFVNSYTGAGNEVRYNENIGRIYADLDGDGASEFAIDLTPGTELTADNFLF